MCVGIPVLLSGNVLGFGNLCSWFGNFIIDAIGRISSISWIYNSAEYYVIDAMVILFTLFFFAFIVLKIKRKRVAVCCLSAFLLSIFLSTFSLGIVAESKSAFNYYTSGSREAIIMQSDGNTTVIDISNPTASSVSDNVDRLKEMKMTSIDKYIFTSYSLLIEAAALLAGGSVKIESIYVPAPQTTEENDLQRLLADEFKSSDIEIITYNLGQWSCPKGRSWPFRQLHADAAWPSCRPTGQCLRSF